MAGAGLHVLLRADIMRDKLKFSEPYEFTASDINVGLSQHTIYNILRQIVEGEINLYPRFQRNLDWTPFR